ncbi:DUF418 domain-containing protein [Lysinibacillus sphaericus]|uniref:DUF418 domain-containing protein n=1 Tax=Lysinibacillus sphaericus TaxID=1421 RepID=UPI003F7B17C3
MLFIGFIHVMFFYDDIIGVYGLITLLFASLFVQLSNKKLGILSVIFLIIVGTLGAFMPRGFDTLHVEVMNRAAMANPIEASFMRIFEWMIYTPLLTYQIIPGVLMGIWIARLRILDYPENHSKKLNKIALIGILISTIGALPMALMSSMLWVNHVDVIELIAKALHTLTGYAGGIGWIALIGLVSCRLENNRGKIITAIAGVGQRSMSFYLFQSIMFVLIFTPYAGDW